MKHLIRLTTISAILAVCISGAWCQTNYKTLAQNAVNDVMGHFWSTSTSSTAGYIQYTYGGLITTQSNRVLWEHATLYIAMENVWEGTGNTTLQQQLLADWLHCYPQYSGQTITSCGSGKTSPAQDDAAWDCFLMIKAYNATGNATALADAQTLANNMFNRWYDSAIGGGMWYSDSKAIKSLYQAASVLDYLKLYEITGTKSYLTHALLCYTWLEKKMLRTDGLYWCDNNAVSGIVGLSTPYAIQQAGSVTFLGGNMAMGVIHARLYKDLGDDIYRQRALRTATALRTYLTDTNGVYVDDRDAWTDGMFAGEWAREVLTLPGTAPGDVQILKNTASAVYTNDRESTGYYGGCWDGPVGTSGDVWSNGGSTPQQIMTSSEAIDIIAGAANLP